MRRWLAAAISLLLVASIAVAPAAARDADRILEHPGLDGYDVPLWPGGSWRDDVRSPEDVLGIPAGARPATHEEILRYFRYLADTFPNVELHEYARSYEGRALVYLVVSSTGNMKRLADIRADIRRLADPRTLRRGQARRIIENTPAVAWCAYGIHGDELSSCDAAMWLAYQLVAGTDDDTRAIRDNLVVLIDPMENPDGRTRWLQMMTSWRGAVPNGDTQSLHHRGMWPQGRHNHYLFDLNRDWFAGIHPESRGRTAVIADWMPQYALDAHEMGPTDTYLFSPPREPFNPHLPAYVRKWWDRVARDQADAFDRYGWAYYTREWNEEFYPGYGSSWPMYLGAVGMLFEQAGVDGSRVRRPEGTTMTYREAVHHQFVGSMANLRTVAEGRRELLEDFFRQKLANVRSDASAYLLPPGENPARRADLVARLRHQGIEIERAVEPFRASRVRSYDGRSERSHEFPEGTLVIPTNQPLRQLVEVLFDFDVRMPTEFLRSERRERLKHGRSRLYEVTAWSMPMAWNLETWYAPQSPRVRTEPLEALAPPPGGVRDGDATIGYVFDNRDDRAMVLVARLLERGVRVRAARRPFRNGDVVYPRGSFQVRRSDNPDLDDDALAELADSTGVTLDPIATTLAGPPWADLGGSEFVLLRRPRVAVVGGPPVSATAFGAAWHLLDARMRMPCSTLEAAAVPSLDLARYDVLVLPPSWGGPGAWKRVLGDGGIEKLRDWVEHGGTLVAEGSAAAMLADTSVALSSVRLRRQVLDRLPRFLRAIEWREKAEAPGVDSLAVWEGTDETNDAGTGGGKKSREDLEALRDADELARRLSPSGAVLAVELDEEHWLAFGVHRPLPVMFAGSYALLAPRSVEVPGRFASADRVRLSGLVWPEARKRLARTAWVTRERRGRGQVILFASVPNFRAMFRGGERVLLNAILLGPGFGARAPQPYGSIRRGSNDARG